MSEQPHNDTASNAIKTGIDSRKSITLSFDGAIGDNFSIADLADDIDLYRFDAGAGDRIEWSTTAYGVPWYSENLIFGGILFNAKGSILATSKQGNITSFSHVIPSNGTYYLGVWGGLGTPFTGTFSSININSYPRSIQGSTRTGDYTLSIRFDDNSPTYPSPQPPPPPPVNIIQSMRGRGVLAGGAGADQFRFGIYDGFGLAKADTIINFNGSQGDKIVFSSAALPSLHGKSKVYFRVATDTSQASSFARSTTDLVYCSWNGNLYVNGNGSAKGWGNSAQGGLLAVLAGQPPLTAANLNWLS